ncbi:hypothetical protein GcM1_211043 [Golovinomyces cichoracearum]|uniref:Uncharacterized protein n=1 Tax=Golovinomyces cichoracearum TaxID=62708 RepID=A0A420IVA3_9PEZI|nr:hypothetical protein GcM1_211043 [Golovinomyces cichoracearum]
MSREEKTRTVGSMRSCGMTGENSFLILKVSGSESQISATCSAFGGGLDSQIGKYHERRSFEKCSTLAWHVSYGVSLRQLNSRAHCELSGQGQIGGEIGRNFDVSGRSQVGKRPIGRFPVSGEQGSFLMINAEDCAKDNKLQCLVGRFQHFAPPTQALVLHSCRGTSANLWDDRPNKLRRTLMPMSLHFSSTTRRGGAVAHLSIDNGIAQLQDLVLHSWPSIDSATDVGNQESTDIPGNASTYIYCENLTDTNMCITELAVMTRNRKLVRSFNEGDSLWLSM